MPLGDKLQWYEERINKINILELYLSICCFHDGKSTFIHHTYIIQRSKSSETDEIRHKADLTTYLKMERSQSQEWVGKAMNTQTAAVSHATETIPMETLENFWPPRYIEKLPNLGWLRILTKKAKEQWINIVLTSYIAIWNKVIAVSRTAWAEKATSFAATGII